MKRVTLATIKSFIRKNEGKLYIKNKSSFDGMIDGCVQHNGARLDIATKTNAFPENTLGVSGAWFVRGGNDYFTAFNDGFFQGYEISNCCGRFLLAVQA